MIKKWEYEDYKNIVRRSRFNITNSIRYNRRLDDSYTCPLIAVFEDNCG